jgi:hypothetical protein
MILQTVRRGRMAFTGLAVAIGIAFGAHLQASAGRQDCIPEGNCGPCELWALNCAWCDSGENSGGGCWVQGYACSEIHCSCEVGSGWGCVQM